MKKYNLYYKYLFFVPILLYFFINKEFVGIRVLMDQKDHSFGLSILLYLLFMTYFIRLLFNKRDLFSIKTLIGPNYFSILLFIWALYMIFFGISNGQVSTASKYVLTMLIFAMIINFSPKDIILAGKYFNFIFSIFSLFLVIQFILIFLFPDYVSETEIIYAVKENLKRSDSSYRIPFGLGFIRYPAGMVSYGDFNFFRQFSFTVEPKYAAVINIALIISLIAFKKKDIIFKPLIISSFLGMFIIHSFAGIGTILVSYVLYKIYNYFKFKPLHLILFFMFFNILLSGFINYILVFLPSNSFALARILGHQTSWYGGSDGVYVLNLILGIFRFGIIGRIIEWIIFSFFISFSIKNMKYMNSSLQRFSVFLAISSYYVFWMNFLPEPITPLLIFIILSIFCIINQEKQNILNPTCIIQ